MNIKRQDVIIAVLVVALAALIFFSFESYEEEVNQFYAPEVYSQPYLALSKHFENYDKKVEVVEDANDVFGLDISSAIIPNVNDVIFIDKGEIVLSKQVANAYIDWIEDGGHIVIGLSAFEGESTFSGNHLLKELGIYTVSARGEEFEDFNGATLINTDDYGEINIEFPNTVFIDTDLYQNIYYSAYPEGNEYSEADINYGYATFMQIDYGRGLITLLSNGDIWHNLVLNNDDNVLLAHQVLNGDTIYLLEYDSPLMWYQLISLYSPAFYFSLLLLILIVLWYSAVRFGAIKRIDSVVVTYFSEHIRAAGNFYWSSGQREKMIDEVRAQLFEEVSIRAATTNHTTEILLATLVKISMWPEDTIHELVISDQSNINQANFIKIMQGLQQLRKMI